MKLDDLILGLEIARETHGNIEVCVGSIGDIKEIENIMKCVFENGIEAILLTDYKEKSFICK